ncbi:MAG: protein translocase subunit SecD [Spirochaetales bacterium]|nr:protein translocase subunit SecD [Spirochaetales bacterium]MBR2317783.1 protein translocase subunit SecD [Spirochaetales bacterium]
MKKSSRLLILLICLAGGFYFLMPSITWYFVYKEKDRDEAGLSGVRLKSEINTRIENGLKAFNDANAGDKELKVLKKEISRKLKEYNSVSAKKLKLASNASFNDMKNILFDMYSYNNKTEEEKNLLVEKVAKKALENYYTAEFDAKRKVKNSAIKLGLDLQGGAYAVVTLNFDHPSVEGKATTDADKAAALDNAVLMIENRINKFGVSEVSIQKIKEQHKIVINLPGVKETSDLRKIIETVGVLEFKVVSKEGSELLSELKRKYDSEGKMFVDNKGNINPEILSQLPPDTEALRVSNKDKYGEDYSQVPFIVVSKESLLGDNPKVKSATVDPDNLGRYVINFTLEGEAVDRWAKATRENIGRQIAIILDDVVLQSPVVQSEIPNGRSQVTLGNLSYEELDDMAKILRSGSLNIPLEIAEENTIGASLGKDSIRSGLFALLVGVIITVVFMIFVYSLGGIVADIALVFNLFFLLAGMGMFNGTLTLPGIAGIILTLGMAVDSNVLIYERVKEEFRSGKSFTTSITLGYEKAFWAIMDGNITTFIAAIGISLFGTGAIKGFAVTLCMGVVSTLFTSLFITRLIWDTINSGTNFKTLRAVSLFRGK